MAQSRKAPCPGTTTRGALRPKPGVTTLAPDELVSENRLTPIHPWTRPRHHCFLPARKGERERLAFTLTRFSPVASFQLAAMQLAGTDIGLKSRYEDALEAYRTSFNKYKAEKQKNSGMSGGISIQVDSDKGVKIDVGREMALDLTGMPEFTTTRPSLAESVSATAVDFGLIAIFSILSFAGAFAMFLRYDPRYAN